MIAYKHDIECLSVVHQPSSGMEQIIGMVCLCCVASHAIVVSLVYRPPLVPMNNLFIY